MAGIDFGAIFPVRAIASDYFLSRDIRDNTTSGMNTPTGQAGTDPATPVSRSIETATLGTGCFWCTEAVFQNLEGVESATSGYSGGHVANPTYEQVCDKTTGHAEVVQVKFDPAVISFGELLEVFWKTHDPTTLFLSLVFNFHTYINFLCFYIY